MPARRLSAAGTAWLVIALAGAAAVLALNFPGHLPYDSVNALWEGRSHLRFTWGPRAYSAILGLFDAVLPGTAIYTIVSVLILTLSWLALPALRPRIAWSGPLLLLLWIAHPEILIFQGVVWRDTLFANLLVAGFVALAWAMTCWSRPRLRWPLLALAALCLAVGGLVRQNGGIVIVPAALAVAWAGWRGGVRALGWTVGAAAAPLLLMAAFDALVPVHQAPGAASLDIGPRLLMNYDLVGAVAEDPQRPLPALAAADPKDLPLLRREARGAYSPVRIDTLNNYPDIGRALWTPGLAAVRAEWLHTVLADPGGYLRRRAEIFRWVVLTPRIESCSPIHLGVDGAADIEAKLGVRNGQTPRDARLYAYASRWFHTPLYNHLTYALLAAAVALVLLVRRSGGADVAIAALMIAALGFTASFFLVSVACDYRYLYPLDLAAITGSLYLALDPRLRGGRRPSTSGRSTA